MGKNTARCYVSSDLPRTIQRSDAAACRSPQRQGPLNGAKAAGSYNLVELMHPKHLAVPEHTDRLFTRLSELWLGVDFPVDL